MHSRSHPQNSAYMEKAIEKATKLIELLTKQNEDLKVELEKIQEQKSPGNIAEEYEALKKLLQINENQLQEKDRQFKLMKGQISDLENKLKQKVHKNKQLHEKIGDLTSKNNQNTKALEKQKKKNLALQNQNEYLLKNFTKFQDKENQFQNYCSYAEEQFRKEMVLMQRTKTAFARKCDQINNENMELRKQIVHLRVTCSDLQKKVAESSEESGRLKQMQLEIKRTNDTLTFIIQSTLKVKADVGLYLKVEQIKNYLTYRLQHIQKLIKPIVQLLGENSCSSKEKMARNLEDLSTLATRLSTYLGDLIK